MKSEQAYLFLVNCGFAPRFTIKTWQCPWGLVSRSPWYDWSWVASPHAWPGVKWLINTWSLGRGVEGGWLCSSTCGETTQPVVQTDTADPDWLEGWQNTTFFFFNQPSFVELTTKWVFSDKTYFQTTFQTAAQSNSKKTIKSDFSNLWLWKLLGRHTSTSTFFLTKRVWQLAIDWLYSIYWMQFFSVWIWRKCKNTMCTFALFYGLGSFFHTYMLLHICFFSFFVHSEREKWGYR